MTRREVARKFDEIVAFAEIEKFIDTPVKRYSSGMYVRLAFGVAAHLETDVLLVDEVLAVGDSAFQRKSMGKMNEVAKGGRTVLFVSHNLSAIRNLCSRTLLIEGGRLKYGGTTNETLSIYESGLNTPGGQLTEKDFSGPLSGQIVFSKLVVTQGDSEANVIDPMRDFEIEVHGFAMKSFMALDMNIAIYRDGVHIASCHDSDAETRLCQGTFVSRYKLSSDLFRAGKYTIGIGAVSPPEYWLWGGDIGTLVFSENLGGRVPHRVAGIVSVPYLAERVQPTDSDPSR
jgi:lipopolysaccharide transport system ATP-binding protein